MRNALLFITDPTGKGFVFSIIRTVLTEKEMRTWLDFENYENEQEAMVDNIIKDFVVEDSSPAGEATVGHKTCHDDDREKNQCSPHSDRCSSLYNVWVSRGACFAFQCSSGLSLS